MTRWIKYMLAGIILLPLGACTSFWQWSQDYDARDGLSSSLVGYLYPQGEIPPAPPQTIPRLDLPLRVGIAFVPPGYDAGDAGTIVLSEATRTQLLSRVAESFKERHYIAHIEVIPETYLRSSAGLDGMRQVARLYGTDVMALVSYDQVAVSEDRKSSFLYWTIVGAYVIKGTDNEVQTFVDTAVFDVKTGKLLFRAPGTDRISARSTAIESNEVVRKSRDASFSAALADMSTRLADELDLFEQRVANDPDVAEVRWGGGGSASIGFLIMLILAACGSRRPGGWFRR